MEDCLFCKIIADEIPCYKFYEDDHVLAFLDITQTTQGHTLVIPKKHSRNVLSLSEEEAAALFKVIPSIGNQLMRALGASGLNLLQNNEASASQSVFHTHVHLIPRYTGDASELGLTFTDHSGKDLSQILSKIKGAV